MKRSLMILLTALSMFSNAAAAANLLISGSDSSRIRVWDEDNGTLVRTMTEARAVQAMTLTINRTLLLTGGTSSIIRVWNFLTGENVRNLTGHQSPIAALTFSPNGTLLFSGDDGGTSELRVWVFDSGSPVRRHSSTIRSFFAIGVSKDNLYYFDAGDTDNGISQWSVNTGDLIRTLDALRMPDMFAMATTTSGIFFVGGSGDDNIRAFDISTGVLMHNMTGHTAVINAILLSADESTLYSVAEDRTLKAWSTSTFMSTASIAQEFALLSVALTASADTVYVGDNRGQIHRLNVTAGSKTQNLTDSGTIYALVHVTVPDPVTPTPTGVSTTSNPTIANVTLPASGVMSPGAVASIVMGVILFFINSH